jgi:NitT/TauT family transport system permease protein
LFVLVLLGWQAATLVFAIRPFLLPSPVAVLESAIQNGRVLAQAVWLTAAAAVCGFTASLVLGCLIAFAFAQSQLVRRSCYPYAIFLQTVPIVAIAPLIMVWFGSGFHSVVIVSFVVSLFPVITNMTSGLSSVDRDHANLFRLYRAGRWATLWKLRVPSAVPYLIAGAKTSSGLSVIGAIVGEFFAGYGTQQHGLGYLITMASGQLRTAYLFAAVLGSTLLGLLMFTVVSSVGDAVLAKWYRNQLND